MNTPNPLVPQGTTPAGGKSTVRIAVLTILVVHVALIGGMLIQGCSKDKPVNTEVADAANSALPTNDTVVPVETNAVSPLATSSNAAMPEVAPAATSAVSPLVSTPAANAVQPSPTAGYTPAPLPTPTATTPAVTTSASTSEYVVVKGDTLAVIAKKHSVSRKALEDANPGIDARKLKVGQKLQIPAPAASTAVAATATSPAAAPDAAVDASAVYTVKPGDVLARIAKNHHTTVKAIVAANNLKSQNSLKVGQKLKMPAPKAPAAAATDAIPGPTASAAAPMTPAAGN